MPTLIRLEASSLPDILDRCAQVIRTNGVIAMPTESFYALAAAATQPAAVRRVYELKGRAEGKPILVLIADRTQLHALVDHIPPAAELLMNAYWPGPLTLVFPASPVLPNDLTAGTGSVGIRELGVTELKLILQHIGPVTGTSANRSGSPPARTAEEVQSAFDDGNRSDLGWWGDRLEASPQRSWTQGILCRFFAKDRSAVSRFRRP